MSGTWLTRYFNLCHSSEIFPLFNKCSVFGYGNPGARLVVFQEASVTVVPISLSHASRYGLNSSSICLLRELFLGGSILQQGIPEHTAQPRFVPSKSRNTPGKPFQGVPNQLLSRTLRSVTRHAPTAAAPLLFWVWSMQVGVGGMCWGTSQLGHLPPGCRHVLSHYFTVSSFSSCSSLPVPEEPLL